MTADSRAALDRESEMTERNANQRRSQTGNRPATAQ